MIVLRGGRVRRFFLCVGATALAVIAWGQPSHAEEVDGWSIVLTPQVWVSHISNNGFAAPSKLSTFGVFDVDESVKTHSEPESINPQTGIQFVARKGPWSIAGAGQFVPFTTKNSYSLPGTTTLSQVLDVDPDPSNPLPVIAFVGKFAGGTPLIQESIDTNRIDLDLAASYFFPDVVKDWFDLSVGMGAKYIYASASRRLTGSVSLPLSQCSLDLATCQPVQIPGLPSAVSSPGYLLCKKDDCSDARFKREVSNKSYFYGATFPTTVVFHLSKDKRLLLPFSANLFLGGETRDDADVVYATTPDASSPSGFKVKRLDGTTFAYGVTSDATVRYLFDVGGVGVSVYAGMRVQAIKGHEQFLAWGPIIGLSMLFGN